MMSQAWVWNFILDLLTNRFKPLLDLNLKIYEYNSSKGFEPEWVRVRLTVYNSIGLLNSRIQLSSLKNIISISTNAMEFIMKKGIDCVFFKEWQCPMKNMWRNSSSISLCSTKNYYEI